jgi:hypothetical protein
MLKLEFPLRVPSELIDELVAFTGSPCSGLDLEPYVCDAIRAYMKPATMQPVAAATAAAETGYQWKQLFLPEGTRLRACFDRKPYFAMVRGNEINCDGCGMSPSGFANLFGSGNRNAWKAIWLRFPGVEQWVLAETCRALQETAVANMFAAGPAAPHNNPKRRGKRGKHRK